MNAMRRSVIEGPPKSVAFQQRISEPSIREVCFCVTVASERIAAIICLC
jgi:hypothetical protein